MGDALLGESGFKTRREIFKIRDIHTIQ